MGEGYGKAVFEWVQKFGQLKARRLARVQTRKICYLSSMSATDTDKQRIVDENYIAFSEMLPELIKTNAGKFVVMREKEIVEYFDTFRDAMVYGSKTYNDGLFSVQEITQKTVDLGWFSHADLYDTV